MKICTQCKSVFSEDYVFCMNDGTTLIDDSNEQETVVIEKINMPDKTSALSPDMLVTCSSCNLANRANSKFCKKCGTALQLDLIADNQISLQIQQQGQISQSIPQQEPIQSTDSPTIVFSPPSSSNSKVNSTANKGKNQMLVVGGLIGSLLLIGIVVIALNFVGDNSAENRNASENSYKTVDSNKSNTTPTPVTIVDVGDSQSMGGREGFASTDLVVRDSPSKYGIQVGVFFMNSKMSVLRSARSETGTIWYRVKIIDYGCSRVVDKCGKDKSFDSEEGWVFSKYVNFRY